MLDLTVEGHAVSRDALPRFDENRLRPRHRWYDFKEGFSSQLVRHALDSFGGKRPRVLDPFSGCGTTAITSLESGCDVTALEVNPFLAFTVRAKASRSVPSSPAFARTLATVLKKGAIERRSHLEGVSTFTEGPNAQKWLFNRSVLRGFAALDDAIHGVGQLCAPLRLALLSSVMEVCNARRDGKCLRYRTDWKELGFSSDELRTTFTRRAAEIATDLRESRLSGKLRVVRGDARSTLSELPSGSVDITVTSPPYLNSFDYSDVYRPELFLGGFVADNAELMKIRLSTVRSHIQADWPYEPSVQLPQIERVVRRLSKQTDLWNPRLPTMVAAYFADMTVVLRELLRVTRVGGQLWLVVATSAYGSVHIEVDQLLETIGADVGWSAKARHELRRLRSSGQTWARVAKNDQAPLRESLLVFEKKRMRARR